MSQATNSAGLPMLYMWLGKHRHSSVSRYMGQVQLAVLDSAEGGTARLVLSAHDVSNETGMDARTLLCSVVCRACRAIFERRSIILDAFTEESVWRPWDQGDEKRVRIEAIDGDLNVICLGP